MSKFSFLSNLSDKKGLFKKLIGSTEIFSLESRIFHGICIGLIAISLLYVPYNFFADLYIAAFSAIFFLFFYIHQYYYSRFKAKKHNNIIFGLIGIIIFGLNYFSNSGIDGSTDVIWPAYLLIVFAISPYKQHFKWLLVYLFCFICIHFIGYLNPSLIQYPFKAGEGQFIDRITTLPIPVIVIYMIINFIRKSYDRERELTEEKKRAIERKRIQISLQNKELEQSNSEKNKLMSIISHDLRAPLVNIKSYLELLTANEIENNERPLLENALLKSTTNALDMLSNLLHWSKSQMSGTNLQLSNVNLLDTLKSTLEMEKLFSSKKEINLTYQISPSINVIADVDMLQLIVRNLISNAVKFTPQNGNVKIIAELINQKCKLTVIDNGNGISSIKQNDIFSIQANSTYGTNNEKGIGLGLILCKEFIELQNGSIGFESELGVGSTFFIFIPLQPNVISNFN